VLEAEDGGQGLALIKRHDLPIDLILLDRSMPRMCGEQFLVKLRELGRRVPVVLLTGHPGSEAELEGVCAVMMKPPKSEVLLRTIRQLLDEPERTPVNGSRR
jgi:CheY-like chemotaxis protein